MTDSPRPALDFPSLTREVEEQPTVQAGLITVLVRVRNAIELALSVDPIDREYLTWLAGQLDSNSAVLADAVLARTPAEAPHEQRAMEVQRQADQPNAEG